MTREPTGGDRSLPIDAALLAVVRCPVTGERLERACDELRTASGRVYRIVDGLPVLVPGREPHQGDHDAGTASAGIS